MLRLTICHIRQHQPLGFNDSSWRRVEEACTCSIDLQLAGAGLRQMWT